MSIAALGTLLIGLATAAQTGAPSANPVTTVKQDVVGNDKKNSGTANAAKQTTAAPSAALLEYLGQYEEAADGLDPLGFDGDNTIENGKTATAEKQGSGP